MAYNWLKAKAGSARVGLDILLDLVKSAMQSESVPSLDAGHFYATNRHIFKITRIYGIPAVSLGFCSGIESEKITKKEKKKENLRYAAG